VVDDQLLGFACGIAFDRDDNAGGLALDPTRVLLEEAIVA